MLRVTITFPGGDTTTFDNLLSGDIGPVGTEQLDISMSTKSSGATSSVHLLLQLAPLIQQQAIRTSSRARTRA